MEIYNRFFTTFEFEKVEYHVPGRDWDDDGLASWYVEWGWPNISGDALIELICLTQEYYQTKGLYIRGRDRQELEVECMRAVLTLYELADDEYKTEIKERVKEAFDEDV